MKQKTTHPSASTQFYAAARAVAVAAERLVRTRSYKRHLSYTHETAIRLARLIGREVQLIHEQRLLSQLGIETNPLRRDRSLSSSSAPTPFVPDSDFNPNQSP